MASHVLQGRGETASSASTATLLPTPPAVSVEALGDESETWQRPATARGCGRAPTNPEMLWHPLGCATAHPGLTALSFLAKVSSRPVPQLGPICVPGELSAPLSLGTLHRHCHRHVATELPLPAGVSVWSRQQQPTGRRRPGCCQERARRDGPSGASPGSCHTDAGGDGCDQHHPSPWGERV